MATYVNDLRLKEIATGDESGTWGTSTNTNLELIGEALGYGTQDCFTSDADATTTVADGATDPARSMYFKVTSSATLTATRTLTIAPNTISRVMFIENATTGSQSITISQGSGANVTIATGKTAVVYLDGAGSGAAVVDALALVDPGVTDTLAEVLVAGNTSGGTGLTMSSGDDLTLTGASYNVVWDSSDSALEFADNAKAVFGAGSDLQIYHDGSNSYIDDSGTGNLLIRADSLQLQRASGAQIFLAANTGAEVALYHAGNSKLATTSTGIDVTGTVTADGLTVNTIAVAVSQENGVLFGANAQYGMQLKQYTTSGGTPHASVVAPDDTNGWLSIEVGGDQNEAARFASNGDISFYEDTGTTAKLFWDASAESLGIGTTSPSTKLHLGGTAPLDSIIRQDSTVSGTNWEIGEREAGKWQIWEDDSDSVVATFTSSGNVGIGTTSPASYFPGATNLVLSGTGDSGLTINSGTSSTSRIHFADGTSGDTRYRGYVVYVHTDDSMQFATTGSERMRIDSSGNLLVGRTITPPTAGAKIAIEGSGDTAVQITKTGVVAGRVSAVSTGLAFGVDTSDGATERMRIDSSGNVGIGTSSPSALLEVNSGNDTLPTISPATKAIFATDDTAGFASAISIIANATGNADLFFGDYANEDQGVIRYDNANDAMVFQTNASEAMRIDSSGNLLVGGTSYPDGTDTNWGVNQGGVQASSRNTTSTSIHYTFYNTNGAVGTISTNGSATAYNTSSDQRLKENIVDAPSASDDIDAIQVRSFDWKADGSHQKYGMVAQELQSVAPEAVSVGETEEDMMGVDYSKLVPMMMKEIQSLRARVAQLEGAN